MPRAERFRLLRDTRGRIGLVLLAVVTAAALFAPQLSRVNPDVQRDVVATRFLAPLTTDAHGVWHPLGTDRLGRDVWARLLYGARVSLTVGVLGMLVSLLIGLAIGAAAAAGPMALNLLLLGATDFALGLPRVVLLLLLAALWKPSAVLVVVVLGVTGWMPVARLVYAELRAQLVRPYVEAATALGAHRVRVLLRHALPNALGPVLALATLGVGNAITLEAGLSFLGLGVQPPAASWGSMIASGRDTVVNAPWVGLAPGIALVLVVMGCTLVADAVQEA
ncbi:MAG TPA: ABC transporter permease [Gemmatimonadales bacterium]|jgi:peptide/nickel transport system permease protein|nr:ABC transporter permease [Gemmatimonadales bacterium]